MTKQIATAPPQKATSEAPQPVVYSTTEMPNVIEMHGLPIDVFSYFQADLANTPEKEVEKFKTIFKWASDKCEEKTIGNIVERISRLENQLGAPEFGQKRWDKMWRWVRISMDIDDLEKRREALGRHGWY